MVLSVSGSLTITVWKRRSNALSFQSTSGIRPTWVAPMLLQLAPCQGRLQDVGGIHGTLAFSRAHQRVDFVDEEDDAPFAFRHFVDDGFQTFLKLSFVFGTSDKRTHVEE